MDCGKDVDNSFSRDMDNSFSEFPTYGCWGFEDELDRVFGTSCDWPLLALGDYEETQESILGSLQSGGDLDAKGSMQDDRFGTTLLFEHQVIDEVEHLSSNIWSSNNKENELQVHPQYAAASADHDTVGNSHRMGQSSSAQVSLVSHLELNKGREVDHGHVKLHPGHHVLRSNPTQYWCSSSDNRSRQLPNDQVYLPETIASSSWSTSISRPLLLPPPPSPLACRDQYYSNSPNRSSFTLSSIGDHTSTGTSVTDITPRPNRSVELSGPGLDSQKRDHPNRPHFAYEPVEVAVQLRWQSTLQRGGRSSCFLFNNNEMEVESSLTQRDHSSSLNVAGCYNKNGSEPTLLQPHGDSNSALRSFAPVTPTMSKEVTKKQLVLPSSNSVVPQQYAATIPIPSPRSREELEASSSLSSHGPSSLEFEGGEAAVRTQEPVANASHRINISDWAYEKEAIVLSMLGKQDASDTCHLGLLRELQLVVDDFQNYWKNARVSRIRPSEERSLKTFRRKITGMLNTYCGRIKRRVRYLPEFCKQALSEWVKTDDHQENPYPAKDEIRRLAKDLGLTSNQVEQWFENYRVRYWKPSRSGMRKGKFFRYPAECTATLRSWISSHMDDPNPRREDLRALAESTGMTSAQVKQWCYNFRRRHLNASN